MKLNDTMLFGLAYSYSESLLYALSGSMPPQLLAIDPSSKAVVLRRTIYTWKE